MTIEDPIEFLHRHKNCIVNQRELGADARASRSALKAALRQDPDVILVGEMRDLETIATALTAAETGHLVFATLHTQDTAQTVDRIVDVFPPEQQHQVRVQLSIALQGIVTQQLLPTADGPRPRLRRRGPGADPGGPQPDPRGQDPPDLLGAADRRPHGMQTMDAALADLVRGGKITRELAEARSSAPEELRRLMGTVRGGEDGARWPPSPSRRSTSPALRPRGEIEAEDKQAVAAQLAPRPDRPRHRGAEGPASRRTSWRASSGSSART